MPAGRKTKAGSRSRTGAKGVCKYPRWLRSSTWTWEILALLGSIICDGAVVIILATMRILRLTQWKSSVSINALVATLTTAAKSMHLFSVAGCVGQLKRVYLQSGPSCLEHLELFDELSRGPLSRGPLGAIQSLFRIRWGAAYLSIIITLFASAIDLFAQQVIRFDTENIMEGDYSVVISNTYNYNGTSHVNGADAIQGEFSGILRTSSRLNTNRPRQWAPGCYIQWTIRL